MLKTTSGFLQKKGLSHPTVVIDKDRALANIDRMAAKARSAGAVFRPHFKTHQSAVVGRWFHDAGVRRIAVSSLDMAEHFADLGWRDITLALLLNPLELARAAQLAQHLARNKGRLGLTVDTSEVAGLIATGIKAPTDVWLKIDTGYGRTGILWHDTERIRTTVAQCRGPATAAGLLTHSGHSYAARGPAEITAVYAEAVARMHIAREATGRPNLLISLGDTPCCSVVGDLSACDEIRPGNFVFYDLMQLEIGSCRAQDLAAAIVCPVVGVYPERRQVVLHGGAVHLSKESLSGTDSRRRFGCLGTASAAGFGAVLPQAALVSLSQEHGVVDFAENFGKLAANLAPGDLVLVWPVHACLSCALLRDQMAAPMTI